jgi:hypothetical protein
LQSEGSSADDVTQQHVDMVARLKNMRAEEARLRQLYAKAGSVGDLLAVDDRLSAVRGDIESAQAQLDLLERQVALSSLTITLTEPGAVIRPTTGTSWGLRDAVTIGVQSAVGTIRALVTGAIAVSPLAALLLVAWMLVRATRWLRRRRGSSAAPRETS